MLPLFPLACVLFPGCRLDLQLFEPCYLDMLSRCLRSGEGFGVVAIRAGREVGEVPQQLAEVGCEAQVIDWQQLPNGLLGVRVEGRRRFDLGRIQPQPDRLLLAEVAWREEPDEQPLGEAHAELQALAALLAEHPAMRGLLDTTPGGDLALSNRLGYLLPLTLEQKQQLLGLDDVAARLGLLEVWLEALQER